MTRLSTCKMAMKNMVHSSVWIRGWLRFWLYLFAVSKELVQLVWRCQHLSASLHQFQEVGPRLVQSVLPLSNGGCVRVATVDHLIHHFIHLLHPLQANVVGLWGKLGECLLKHLEHTWPHTMLERVDTITWTSVWSNAIQRPCNKYL